MSSIGINFGFIYGGISRAIDASKELTRFKKICLKKICLKKMRYCRFVCNIEGLAVRKNKVELWILGRNSLQLGAYLPVTARHQYFRQ